MASACQTPELAGVFSSYQINVPQLDADVDREKAKQLGVPLTDLFRHAADLSRLALRERLQPVRPHLPGDRRRPTRRYRAHRRGHRAAQGAQRRGRDGAARLAAAGQASRTGPTSVHALQRLSGRRHQRRPGARASARARPMAAMERLAAETLPNGIGYEWTELTYQQHAGRQHHHARVPALRAAGVPGAGRAVRELVAAAGHHPDRADVSAVRDRPASG